MDQVVVSLVKRLISVPPMESLITASTQQRLNSGGTDRTAHSLLMPARANLSSGGSVGLGLPIPAKDWLPGKMYSKQTLP